MRISTPSVCGCAHMQGTKPQTLAYGLNDSPAGLAVWIVEKYRCAAWASQAASGL
jgi:hypothetical protein